MGWGVEDDGLSVIFDKIIPELITKKLPQVVDIFHWCDATASSSRFNV